jgi:undecaprenyl diphosphate synthase
MDDMVVERLEAGRAGEAANAPFRRLPRHVGFIPDGNRRWAQMRGAHKREGYAAGVEPGLALMRLCRRLGISDISIYGFTKENVRRPSDQVRAFRDACVEFGMRAVECGAALYVLGDARSAIFPGALRPYTSDRGEGGIKVNLLVNYGWEWDLSCAISDRGPSAAPGRIIASARVPPIDLVVRWGGRRRLSGFLPLQCAYADMYVVDTLWPDMQDAEFLAALAWYQEQDITMGG